MSEMSFPDSYDSLSDVQVDDQDAAFFPRLSAFPSQEEIHRSLNLARRATANSEAEACASETEIPQRICCPDPGLLTGGEEGLQDQPCLIHFSLGAAAAGPQHAQGPCTGHCSPRHKQGWTLNLSPKRPLQSRPSRTISVPLDMKFPLSQKPEEMEPHGVTFTFTEMKAQPCVRFCLKDASCELTS
ncbi:hypothetical protein CB1_000093002 [Camelus ferus]|nr:hypothetical protein CB1_000093002 [Camelus ferus]